MYSTLPPQEGKDPKLSSIMTAAAPSASAVLQQESNLSSSIVSKPAIMAAQQPPQVGNDPKLLACMNDDAAIVSSSSSPRANLSVAVSAPSHHQQQLGDAASPTQESIANSLLSFKETSPISTARKAPPGTGTVMADFRPMQTNPVHSLTNSNHNQPTVDASIHKKSDTDSHDHGMLSTVSCASIDVAAEPCINNSNFWLQDEEERFLLGLRMFGWGQWKRIQPIVKTRTNKQIKSHAQKREKVNPEIKIKYSKGACRRGRISSGVLANDARILSSNGGDLLTAIARDDQHHFPPLEEMVKDVYQTNNGDGPNSRVRRYRHTPYHRSTYHPQITKRLHSSPSKQDSVAATDKTAASVPQEQLCTEARYSPGMEVYTRLSNGNWGADIIQAVDSSGPQHLYLLRNHGEGETPTVPEDLIMSKTCFEDMIGELNVRYGLPADAKLTWSHPLPGGTPIYAQWIDRMNLDAHARWNPGTVNSCVLREDGDGYMYHILFDNEEEDSSLHEKSVLHRLDYDKLLKHK